MSGHALGVLSGPWEEVLCGRSVGFRQGTLGWEAQEGGWIFGLKDGFAGQQVSGVCWKVVLDRRAEPLGWADVIGSLILWEGGLASGVRSGRPVLSWVGVWPGLTLYPGSTGGTQCQPSPYYHG